MDYEDLTRFRTAIEGLTKCACDIERTSRHTVVIWAIADSMRSADVVHEVHHLDNIISRFRVVRHLPSSTRAHILRSAVLESSSIKKLGRSTMKVLAAQLSSLALDWGNETELGPLLHGLRQSYSKIPGSTTESEQTTVRQINDLNKQARATLKEAQETVQLVAIDESLDVVEEAICGQWAQLRSVMIKILPLLPKARRLYIDVEVAKVDNLMHECVLFRRSVRNRDIDLPDITAPLGAGNVSRLPAFLPEQVEGNEEDDSDEWEDPVDLCAHDENNEEEEEEEEEEADEGSKSGTGHHVIDLFQQRSPNFQSSIPPMARCQADVKTSSNGIEAFVSSLSVANGFTNFKTSSKASSSHNNTVLDAIEAFMPNDAGVSEKRTTGDKWATKKAINKKKDSAKSVRDRLRAKLGIKKPKKKPS